MPISVLSVHPGLAEGSRIPTLSREGDRIRAVEVLLLLGAGITACLAMAFLATGLKIPGNAIIRAVLPMSLGLACVPRRMGGMVMMGGAFGTALILRTGGVGSLGLGAMTSLVLTGPFLDLALHWAKRGWALYVCFAMAGLAANLGALAARAAPKFLGFDVAKGRPLSAWLPQAIGTYAACGLIAGLLSAAVWFQLRDRNREGTGEPPA